jgi:beta-ribofuranosylaminobenzene 5'-phosphate synthase
MNQAFSVAPTADSRASTTIRRVEVRASSRLHFGLFSWGQDTRQFGGVGVMVERPGLQLVAELPPSFSAADEIASDSETNSAARAEVMRRIAEFQRSWLLHNRVAELPAIRWQVVEAPAPHVGLGTGTQLGLSVAAALYHLAGLAIPNVEQLAQSVKRGLRSAIGAYGFGLGGLIIEPGKFAHETLSPLEQRVAIPDGWRFALVRPRVPAGLHGSEEIKAFGRLPPVPRETTDRLLALARQEIAPAAKAADFERFSQSIFEYGWIAGNCFAPVQGGPFHGPTLTALVECIRGLGVCGVGQSSWGPTLFAVLPNEANARQFAKDLTEQFSEPLDIVLTAADNHGARIDVA